MKKCRMKVLLRILSDDDAFVFGGDRLAKLQGLDLPTFFGAMFQDSDCYFWSCFGLGRLLFLDVFWLGELHLDGASTINGLQMHPATSFYRSNPVSGRD